MSYEIKREYLKRSIEIKKKLGLSIMGIAAGVMGFYDRKPL